MITVGVRLKDGEKRIYHVDSTLDHESVEAAVRNEMPEAAVVLTLVADNKAPITAPAEKEVA